MRTAAPILAALPAALGILFLAGPALGEEVEIEVLEGSPARPVPARLHLTDPAGKPVRGRDLPFWHDHFVSPGRVKLELSPGTYRYQCERGPERSMATGSFTVTAAAGGTASRTIGIALERLADLPAEGWWPGDLHVHRPVADMDLLMAAEDLQVAPAITWWNDRNRWAREEPPARRKVRFEGGRVCDVMAGEDEREGGALLYFNLEKPLSIAGSEREHPSPMVFLDEASRRGAWIDVEKPFWWDAPIWIASGRVHSIGLANNHMCRDRMYESEAWGRPRDVVRLPPPRGNGFWTQEIYYRLLESGLRVPPSAGSASGVLPNPVGYNRVYVHLEGGFDPEKWWEGLRAGRSFVSNGPLLRARASGKLPGHVFTAREGEEVEIELEASLTSRDPVPFLEVIRNGRVERAVPFEEWKRTGKLGQLRFRESGWFLVRVIAERPETFRFASTAPYHVEIPAGRRRVDRASARFFLDWVRERAARIRLEDPRKQEEVIRHHREAERFWEGLANEN